MNEVPNLRQLLEQQIAAGGEAVDRALMERLVQAAESLAATAPPAATATALVPHESAVAVDAALRDTFTVEELGQSVEHSDVRLLLEQSDTVMIGGLRRLRLRTAARDALLLQLQREGRLDTLLQSADVGPAQDQTGRNTLWLRRCLRGSEGAAQAQSVDDLRAFVLALEQLQGVADRFSLPSLQEARRQLALAEWLEPLRTLVGARGSVLESAASDRFAGRAAELELLRSFVDELDSQSWRESLSRTLANIGGKLRQLLGGHRAGVLMLEAAGGLGKSTLIAKFILDHARSPQRPVPTVYLDFDRAELQPRSPPQLLRETMRQLRLQFPEWARQHDALNANLEQLLRYESDGFKPDAARVSWDELLEDLKTALGELLYERVLLLVLDTLEVVQPDGNAMSGICRFVDTVQAAAPERVRIVAAGRARVPELLSASAYRAEGVVHVLEPLSVTDARRMIEKLGRELLAADWLPAWTRCLAGSSSADARRREPLALRVAVELVRAAEPAQRDALARDLETLQADALGGFVGPLYQRRVLDHVRDPEVRKLAWPGLVLRRITRQLARDVLMQPCGIAEENLDRIFEALAREVWIVTREGDVLRHRPDLRSRTLPLMRQYRDAQGRQLFPLINAAAVNYFAERRHSDLAARAEWIYHRLLAGESTRTLQDDWSDELAPSLIDAVQDFPPGSEQHAFLLVRTARRLLSAERVLDMGERNALEHLSRVGRLARFDDDKLVPLINKMDLSADATVDLPPVLLAARYALAARTGWWRGLSLDKPGGGWFESTVVAYHYLLACHAGTRPDLASRLLFPPDMVFKFTTDSVTAAEALVYQLVVLSFERNSSYGMVDTLLSDLLQQRAIGVSARVAALCRLAVRYGEHCAPVALQKFIDSLYAERARGLVNFSMAEILALLEPGIDEAFGDAIRKLGLQPRAGGGARMSAAMIGHHALLIGPVTASLQRLLPALMKQPGSVQAMALRGFAMARDPIWVSPMAYAAERLGKDDARTGAREALFSRALRYWRGAQVVWQAPETPEIKDMLQLFRAADRSTGIAGLAQWLVESCDSKLSSDLSDLLQRYHAWKDVSTLPSASSLQK